VRGENVEVPIHPDETLDSPLRKKLKIIQKRKGYRYSIDAILLAHFCHLQKGNFEIVLRARPSMLRSVTLPIVRFEPGRSIHNLKRLSPGMRFSGP